MGSMPDWAGLATDSTESWAAVLDGFPLDRIAAGTRRNDAAHRAVAPSAGGALSGVTHLALKASTSSDG
jgi:hypothetical protein